MLLSGLLVMIWGPTPLMHVGGVRVSMSSPRRAFALAAIVLAVRHWLVPRHPILARLLTRYHNPSDTGEVQLFAAPEASLWPRRLGELAIVTLGFCGVVAAATWPQIARLDSVPDVGDPLFSVWRIAWIAHQLPRDPLHLFDGNMFHPERLTLTYSDPVLVPAIMSAPFFWLGGHPLTVYNLLFLSGFAFSGVTTYYLVRALTGRRDAGAVAGIIFALYPYRFEHYSHLELQMTMWMPVTLWGLHRTIANGRVRDGLMTGVAFALQTLSSLYYGLYMAVCMVPLAVILWLARRRPAPPVRALAAGAALAGVLIAPAAAQYLRNRTMLGERSLDAVQYYSARPSDYLEPHFRSRFYGEWSEGGQPERQLFPGIAPVALTVVALWPPVSVARLAYGVALAVGLDGSFGYNGTIYPWLREYLLPFRGLRVPARFSILVGMILSILAGYGAARLLDRWQRWQVPLAGVLLAVVAIEPLPRLELEPVWRQPPAIYNSLSPTKPAVLAEFPTPEDWTQFYRDTRYLYFSTFHWQKLVNGNSGFSPPSYLEFIERVGDFPSGRALDYLRSRQVQYIGVHGAFYEEGFPQVVDALAARSDLEFVSSVRWEGGESRLYRFK
jgi:hypothetical protein